MRCKYCGGEINLSVGRCIGCGRSVDNTADIRILHDLDALAEKYGLDPASDKYDAVVEMEEKNVLDQRTSAGPAPFDLKAAVVPGIGLETYYELLGDGMQYQQDSGQTDIYVMVPEEGTDDADETPAEELSDGSAAETPETSDEETQEADDGFFADVRHRIELLLDRVDDFTAPVTERVREWYSAKMPQLNRAKSSSKWERLAVVGIIAAVLVLVVVIISSIVASIPSDISGEWRVGDENARNLFTVEFSGGEVIARVYDDSGEAHIYKTGVYDISRKNGRDLLTIEYDDGGLSHLYYDIKGRTGEFVNVDTGGSDRYERID